MLNRLSKRVLHEMVTSSGYSFSLVKNSTPNYKSYPTHNTDSLSRSSTEYFNYFLRYKTHSNQNCITKAQLFSALSSEQSNVFEKDNVKYLEDVNKKIMELETWCANLHKNLGYSSTGCNEKLNELKNYLSYIKKYIVIEENLREPQVVGLMSRIKELLKTLLSMKPKSERFNEFNKVKTIIRIYSLFTEYDVISSQTFNNELAFWITFSNQNDIFVLKSAIMQILDQSKYIMMSHNKKLLAEEIESLNLEYFLNSSQEHKLIIIEDVLRCLNYSDILYENKNSHQNIVKIFLAPEFISAIENANNLANIDLMSRYLIGIKKFKELWASHANYTRIVLSYIRKIIESSQFLHMDKDKGKLLHIALMFNFLSSTIDPDNEADVKEYKSLMRVLIIYEQNKKLLKSGINTFYKELIHSIMQNPELTKQVVPELLMVLNAINEDREKFNHLFIKFFSETVVKHSVTIETLDPNVNNSFQKIIKKISAHVRKDYDKIGYMTINTFAKLIFLQGISEHVETFKVLASFNSKPVDLVHFIYSLNFWSLFLLNCKEHEVSGYSIRLQEFLYKNDIHGLIDNFYVKYQNNTGEYIRLIERLEELYADIKFEKRDKDKHATYRVKPLKRSYEMIFIEILQKLANNNQQMYSYFAKDSQAIKVFLSMLKNVVQLISSYNVKFYENINEILFDFLKCDKQKFDLRAKCNFFMILACQNYHSTYSEYIYVQVFNDIVDSIEASSHNLTHQFFTLKNTRAFYLLHDVKGMNYEKLGKMLTTYILENDISKSPDIFAYCCNLLSVIPVKPSVALIKRFDQQIINDLPKIENFLSTRVKEGLLILMELYRLAVMLKYVKKSRYLSDESFNTIKKLIDEYIQVNKVNSVGKPTSSHVHGQIEVILNRLGIEFEAEVNFGLGSQDLIIKPNIIIEIAGNVHFFNGEVDLKIQSNTKIFNKMGYEYVIINDYDFTQSVNKSEFMKEKCLKIKHLAEIMNKSSAKQIK